MIALVSMVAQKWAIQITPLSKRVVVSAALSKDKCRASKAGSLSKDGGLYFLSSGSFKRSKWFATSSMAMDAQPMAKNSHWCNMAVPITVMRMVQPTAILAFLLKGFICLNSSKKLSNC